MQELIEFIDDKFIVSNSTQISSIYHKAQELLEKEEEQIRNAYILGHYDSSLDIYNPSECYSEIKNQNK